MYQQYKDNMVLDVYVMHLSAPCRAVMLACKLGKIDVKFVETDLGKGAHLTPEYVKMNPEHTIPTLNDDGYCLHESRAIMAYLADKYSKDPELYPKDLKKRGKVNFFLYFDMEKLYRKIGAYGYPKVLKGLPLDPEKLKEVDDILKVLDTYLEGNQYVTGDNITIADCSIIASLTFMIVLDYDFSNVKNVKNYIERMKKLSDFEEVHCKGMEQVKAYMNSHDKE